MYPKLSKTGASTCEHLTDSSGWEEEGMERRQGDNPSRICVVDEAGGIISVLWEKLGHKSERPYLRCHGDSSKAQASFSSLLLSQGSII